MSKSKHTPGPNRVSIETVLQGSNEEPVDFNCRSMKQALQLRSALAAAPEMLEALENMAATLRTIKRASGLESDVAEMLDLNNHLTVLNHVIAKAKGGAK